MMEPGLQPWERAELPWPAGEGMKFAGLVAVGEGWALSHKAGLPTCALILML